MKATLPSSSQIGFMKIIILVVVADYISASLISFRNRIRKTSSVFRDRREGCDYQYSQCLLRGEADEQLKMKMHIIRTIFYSPPLRGALMSMLHKKYIAPTFKSG